MSKVIALLVGINNYHPDSGVSGLNGCLNDVKAMKSFLEDNVPKDKLSLKVLKDKTATRENVIKNFQNHLIKNANPGDTALFYYCGHGSFSPTAKEFEHLDPKKQDETLVCYDSRLPGNYDLSDKELALLLHKIEDGVNMVFLADSCHSGSITRGAEKGALGKARFTGKRSDDRTLDSYNLIKDDYYVKLLEEKGEVSVPRSKHIVLAACDRDEEAWETEEGRGLFSTTLLNVLNQNSRVSYSDLFARVRSTIRMKSTVQMPGIYAYEQFNHNKLFLQDKVSDNRKQHLIKFVDNKWRMEFGAIHGMPTNKDAIKEIQIAIFPDIIETKDRDEVLKTVGIKEVKLKECILDYDGEDHAAKLLGEIVSMPTGMPVLLEGTKKAKADFLKIYNAQTSPFLDISDEHSNAKYKLKINKKQLLVHEIDGNKMLHGFNGNDKKAVSYITEILQSIEEWERLANLKNDDCQLNTGDIEIAFFEEKPDRKLEKAASENIKIDYPAAKDIEAKHVVWYQIKIRNTGKQNLHVALLHLTPDFSVVPDAQCQEIPKKSKWITLDDQHGFVIENPKDNQAVDLFKVLVSTAPFDDYVFSSEGFKIGEIKEPTRGTVSRETVSREKAEDDWFAKTLTVTTTRKASSVGKDDVKLAEGITIKGHSKFKADVGFGSVKSSTRNAHASKMLPEIFRSYGEIENLSKTRSAQDKSIIELSGISNEASLKDNPLEININKKLADNEFYVPVTYDGEFVIPVGLASKNEDGTTDIKISELPAVDDLSRQRKSRSLKKALWFCLLKVAGFENDVFKLRVAGINGKGELSRSKTAIASKVDKANKIVVVVHGIIGDTKSMAEGLMFLIKQKHYDLMLTFDYENLNEPIEDIAQHFNDQLKAVGLNGRDGKEVHIIAHSMGGLVSRYMIENIRKGDKMIDRLIMFGTPNGGSPFGSIPQYITLLPKLMAVALNFAKPMVGRIVSKLGFLKKAAGLPGKVTYTLDQMNPDGKFIKTLFKNKKPKTEYVVIAGNIIGYITSEDQVMARFVENTMLRVGKIANSNAPNDIAVAVDQITAIPASFEVKEFEITGHHLNYFEEGEAMKVLRKYYAEESK